MLRWHRSPERRTKVSSPRTGGPSGAPEGFTPPSCEGAHAGPIEPPAPPLPAGTARTGPTALVLCDRPDLGDAVAAGVAAAGWCPHRRPLAAVLAGSADSRSAEVGAVVVAGEDASDLADAVAHVRGDHPSTPIVVLSDRPDGELLRRILRDRFGHVACGTTGDDVAELLRHAGSATGCATSAAVAAALLGRLGRGHRGHDLELAGALLTAGDRARLLDALGARPDLLAAVVDDAARRALKRLALDASAEDRRWLALVLDP